MRAVVIDQQGAVSVVEARSAPLGPGEVRVGVDLVGICATDVHIHHGTFPTARYPVTPGHEATGVVAEIGADVTAVAPGDRVVIDPGMACTMCAMCRRGRPNLCEHREAYGITRTGAAAQSVVVAAGNCHIVPSTTPARAAVLAEPLACVIHAFDLVEPVGSLNVLIYGGGTIGLLAASVARALGAASITVVELDDGRRSNTRTAGFVSAASPDEADAAEWDLVVDATGAIPAIAEGIERLRRGGTLLQIGVAHPDAVLEVSPYAIFARELTIVGSMTTRHSFPRAIQMLDAGWVPVDAIVGEPYGLDDYDAAIEQAGKGRTLKVTVAPHA